VAFVQLSSRVYRYEDTCNVYVLTSGARALLVDLGSGSVLTDLGGIGVAHVDWVLHTHHHRDQCSGDVRLGPETRIAAPAAEAASFRDVERLWQTMAVYDVYDGASVNNIVARNLRVDRELDDYDVFEWEHLSITARPTPGHTRGSVTYVVRIDGLTYAFCGDLVHSPGTVWTIHDLSWWYGEADGFKSAVASARGLRELDLDRLAPSHGPVMNEPDSALRELELNLAAHIRVIDQPYPLPPRADELADGVFERLSERLVAVTHTCANFYVLLGDDGEALFFDYGFAAEHHFKANFRFVRHSLDELRARFGIERPSVVVPTHYHDDHVAGISFLQDQYGTEVWAVDTFADLLERPHRYKLPCLWKQPVEVSRLITDGEIVEWAGIRLEARHAPGHTWYAAVFLGEVDGRRIAFTGDAVNRTANETTWGGRPVYRNRLGVHDFSTTAKLLLDYGPEVLLTGHRGAVQVTHEDLEQFLSWAREFEQTLCTLAPDEQTIGFQLDPDLVTVYPYQARGTPGVRFELEAEVRNHYPHAADAEIRLVAPDAWDVEPSFRRTHARAGASARVAFSVVPPGDAVLGVRHVLLAEVMLDGRRLGQVAESLVVLE
jgi:glyoxylase-like metal-dependent hydrolase (beta-lactamase superfamily II)